MTRLAQSSIEPVFPILIAAGVTGMGIPPSRYEEKGVWQAVRQAANFSRFGARLIDRVLLQLEVLDDRTEQVGRQERQRAEQQDDSDEEPDKERVVRTE